MSDQLVPSVSIRRTNMDANANRSNILYQPDTLRDMRSKLLIFLSFCCIMVGSVWLAICVSFYVIGVEYHVMNVMYESRWIPCTLLLSGLSAAGLSLWRYQTFYITCACMALYSCSGCIVAVLVYSMNFRKALYLLHPPITNRMAGYPRRKYLQLCACMIIVTLLGFCLSVFVLIKLYHISLCYYKKLNLHKTQKGYLIFSSLIQLPLIWFSIYLTSHVISLPFSYVHQYMIQELLCALTLKFLIIIQAGHYIRATRLSLYLLLILNGCQTVQEIFYTWNSYYISLYIHTSKTKLALGVETDQYLMSINFLGHFVRTCIAAYTTYQFSIWLKAPFVHGYCRLEMNRTTKRALISLAAASLILAACHVFLDVLYTITAHIYRTLIAFTGISVFYLSLIGVSLALFLRSGYMLLLVIAGVFLLLLSAVSTHALYIYMETSFHSTLFSHLETMGKDKRMSSCMHFTEALLSVLAMILCLIGGVFIFRLLHMDSTHDRRDGRLKRPLLSLFVLGIVQLELAAVNAALIMSVRDDTKVFQSMLDYGLLDSMSMFVMCLAQIYVCRPANNHISYGLTALLLFLICECLTTYNYLSTKTTYVQLLIVFSQMFSGVPPLKQNVPGTLFPAEEVGLMVAAHVVQLVQWILTLVSMVLAALALEKLHEQRNQITTSTDTSTGPVQLPAVSYTVAKRGNVQQGTDLTSPKPQKAVEENGCQDMTAANISNGSRRHVSYDNPLFDDESQKKSNLDGITTEHAGSKTGDMECGKLLSENDNLTSKEEHESQLIKKDETNN